LCIDKILNIPSLVSNSPRLPSKEIIAHIKNFQILPCPTPINRTKSYRSKSNLIKSSRLLNHNILMMRFHVMSDNNKFLMYTYYKYFVYNRLFVHNKEKIAHAHIYCTQIFCHTDDSQFFFVRYFLSAFFVSPHKKNYINFISRHTATFDLSLIVFFRVKFFCYLQRNFF